MSLRDDSDRMIEVMSARNAELEFELKRLLDLSEHWECMSFKANVRSQNASTRDGQGAVRLPREPVCVRLGTSPGAPGEATLSAQLFPRRVHHAADVAKQARSARRDRVWRARRQEVQGAVRARIIWTVANLIG